MKHFFSVLTSIVFLITPALALADAQSPFQPSAAQLLTRVAALEAQLASVQKNQPLACAMRFSTPTARIGQEVILAWGSRGAVEQNKDTLNMRATNGAFTMLFSQPGVWRYSFIFYDSSGAAVPCDASIKITA